MVSQVPQNPSMKWVSEPFTPIECAGIAFALDKFRVHLSDVSDRGSALIPIVARSHDNSSWMSSVLPYDSFSCS